MRFVRIFVASSTIAVMSAIAISDAVGADATVPIHTRSLSTMEHDYGQAGADVYWESEAAQTATQETGSANDVAVGAAPPVQRDAGWYGRSGGYEGSDRVERVDELGHSSNADPQSLKAHAQTSYGRAGGLLSPTDSN